jgi:hypothetical protein
MKINQKQNGYKPNNRQNIIDKKWFTAENRPPDKVVAVKVVEVA